MMQGGCDHSRCNNAQISLLQVVDALPPLRFTKLTHFNDVQPENNAPGMPPDSEFQVRVSPLCVRTRIAVRK